MLKFHSIHDHIIVFANFLKLSDNFIRVIVRCDTCTDDFLLIAAKLEFSKKSSMQSDSVCKTTLKNMYHFLNSAKIDRKIIVVVGRRLDDIEW